MKLLHLFEIMGYHPTEHERAVLAIIATSDTPQLADEQASKGAQLITATNRLIQLRFITRVSGALTLTQAGQELCDQQAIGSDSQDKATQLASEYT